MRILAIVSQKGGVGKTSLVQNLSAELARAGRRVLMVDFDPQANLTTGWGLDPGAERPTVYQAMLAPAETRQAILQVRPNLDLLPASLDLAGAEKAFGDAVDRNNKLKKVLRGLQGAYQLVLIDGPPSLGFFTINALVAATDALLPLQTEVYAYKMIDPVLAIIEEVREVNEGLRLFGIALTMYDTRNSLTETVERLARQRFGERVFRAVIPKNVRIAEAPADGVPVGEYQPGAKGAQAYRTLAAEVLERVEAQ
jgi:chromosome partitioning protein